MNKEKIIKELKDIGLFKEEEIKKVIETIPKEELSTDIVLDKLIEFQEKELKEKIKTKTPWKYIYTLAIIVIVLILISTFLGIRLGFTVFDF